MEFDWDEHNLFHIAQHGVTREDAESALSARPVFVTNQLKNGEERTTLVGRTSAGRMLTLVTTVRRGKIRVVTAFSASKYLRGEYAFKRGNKHESD